MLPAALEQRVLGEPRVLRVTKSLTASPYFASVVPNCGDLKDTGVHHYDIPQSCLGTSLAEMTIMSFLRSVILLKSSRRHP